MADDFFGDVAAAQPDAKTVARNKRLDDLVKLTQSWSAQVQKETNSRVTQLQRLLDGRGVGAMTKSTVQAASELVVDEIDNFLKG